MCAGPERSLNNLFAPKIVFNDLPNHQFPVITTNRNTMLRNANSIAIDGVNLRNGDNIGLMDPDKSLVVEVLLDIFQIQEGKKFALGRIDRDIVLEGLDVKDICKVDLFEFITAFDKYKVFAALQAGGIGGWWFDGKQLIIPGPDYSFEETVKGDWF
jgi:hypothetical protein